MKLRRRPTLVKAIPRLEMCGNCLVTASKTIGGTQKENQAKNCSRTSCWSCDDPIFIAPSWFSAPPLLTLPTGAGPDHWRNELLYREGDIERHPGPKRALPSRGRDVPLQDALPTTAQHYDVAVSEFEEYLRVQEIHGPEKIVSHDLNDIRNAVLCALKLSVTLWPPLAARAT